VRRHEAGTNVYVFHQVKAKDKQNHLWSFLEIFGVSSHKSFKGDCRVGFAWNMLEHHLSFGEQCKEVFIVTNVSFDDKVADFLKDVASVDKLDELKPASANQFGLIAKFYGQAKAALTPERLFTFFKKFQVRSLAGALDDSENSDASIILQRVFEFSEVSLDMRQAKKIAKGLVDLVRVKSITKIAPGMSVAELEAKTSVGLDDILPLFSITPSAYALLRAAKSDRAFLQASILQRLLASMEYSDSLISKACEFKIDWDAWYITMRHTPAQADILFMLHRCEQLSKRNLIDAKGADALENGIAKIFEEFGPKLNVERPLTKDLVFGAFLSAVVNKEIGS
jgi:hypothetical protein